jgi:hypothetical protein
MASFFVRNPGSALDWESPLDGSGRPRDFLRKSSIAFPLSARQSNGRQSSQPAWEPETRRIPDGAPCWRRPEMGWH